MNNTRKSLLVEVIETNNRSRFKEFKYSELVGIFKYNRKLVNWDKVEEETNSLLEFIEQEYRFKNELR